MPEPKDPDITVIKVTTDTTDLNYYVQFSRDTHTLIGVWEYRRIWVPLKNMTPRVRAVVDSARTRIGPEALETTGEKQ